MAINLLQEKCQGRGYPVYVFTQHGSPHQPTWYAEVYIPCLKESFIGDECPTKKEAKTNAASKALKHVDSILTTTSSPQNHIDLSKNCENSQVVTKNTALIVDVENMPKFITQLPVFEGPFMIYAFVGKHHPLAHVDYGSDVIKVISPSTRKDGTDTCIQVYIGMLLMQNTIDVYLIATRDHFGGALVDLITSDTFRWNAKKAEIVTNVDHVLTCISKN